MAKVKWVPTSEAIDALGISRWSLYNTLRPKLKNTRTTKYWKTVNPHAKRKTYQWNLKAIEDWQSTEL